jgi:hypothetical protein
MKPGPKPIHRKGVPGACIVEDCPKQIFARGLCHSHYLVMLDGEKRAGWVVGKNGKAKPGRGALGERGTSKYNGGGATPKIVHDESTIKRIRDLGGLQCTLTEVAGVLQCNVETLRSFLARHEDAADAYRDGKENGKASLRRMQFVLAKRSAAMSIHLGKNYLNQRDNLEIGPINGGSLETDLGSEENATALLRAVRAESE